MAGRSRTRRAGVAGISALLSLGAVAGGVPAGAAAGRGADSIGQWTQPFEERRPVDATGPAAVESAVLGDGRVLYLRGLDMAPPAAKSPVGESQARILDLRSGTPQWTAAGNDSGLPATDLTTLPDGRLLLAGGTGDTWLFDPRVEAFVPAPPMQHGRWYPHVAMAADGNPVAFGGATQAVADPRESGVRRTETWHVANGTWEENDAGPDSEATLPLQPRIVLAPDGRFFYAAAGQLGGAFGRAADEAAMGLFQFFDPRTKTWSLSGLAPYGARSGAFVVPLTLEPPFDRMTLVTAGGVLGSAPGLPANPLTMLTAIDGNGNVGNRNGGDLKRARANASAVLLPDGRVLAVGGTDRDDSLNPGVGSPVLVPELYDPTTNEWTEVAPQGRGRGFHGTALLLPDMRVLLGGGDGDASFEIWSPPYLFRGARPSVVRVQRGISHGETFTVTTPDAALVESVLLLRTPSPQHGNDSDQRAVRLEFTRSGATTLTATAPPSARVAPPGTYYLVVNKRGLQGPIPSVARMVDVGRTDLSDAPQPFPTDAPAPSGGSAQNPPSGPAPVTIPLRHWLSVAP
jgi:hypothetical protein